MLRLGWWGEAVAKDKEKRGDSGGEEGCWFFVDVEGVLRLLPSLDPHGLASGDNGPAALEGGFCAGGEARGAGPPT